MNPYTNTTPEQISPVAAEFPTLGSQGFGRPTPLPVDARFRTQIDAVRQFIRNTPRASIRGRGSYALKHEVELRLPKTYISNGAMIVGAVLEGLAVIRSADRTSPNCKFS